MAFELQARENQENQQQQQQEQQEQQQHQKCPVDPSVYKHFLPPQPQQPTGTDRETVDVASAPGPNCPIPRDSRNATGSPLPPKQLPATECPVGHHDRGGDPSFMERKQKEDPRNNMPAVAEQHRAPSQHTALSTHRELSTIPIATDADEPASNSVSVGSSCNSVAMAGDAATSGKKRKENDYDDQQQRVWIYPSEQMFFNAMRRKNWNPREEDMKVVVPIHNAVNERCWKEILLWESSHDSGECGGPKLVKFEGKPGDYTPKARLRWLLGYSLPFDRHDWVVSRCGGRQATYVIDFYSGKPNPHDPDAPSFFLDVRPAFTPEGVRDRVRRWWKHLF